MSEFSRPLRRSVHNRSIAGVCGGIAEYFGLDPTLVRVIYALLSLGSLGTGILVYFVLWVLIPEREYY
jgi:phage shock protein PspC (stress-responsive transcriptional regulator)